MSRLSNSEFIEKSKKIHKDKYDYSAVNYVNSFTEVDILCKKHGLFKQKPSFHMRGSNCPKCAREICTEKRLNTDIIYRFNSIHNNYYDYSKVIYKGMHIKIEIVCKKHGSFFQTPSSHIKKSGCPKCGIEKNIDNRKFSKDLFIEKAIEIHGDFYNYEKSVYEKSTKDIEIICPEHGVFLQKPYIHLQGHGCPKHKGQHLLLTTNTWIDRFRKTHGNTYDYSNIEYINSDNNIAITCKKHGIFYQNCHHHWYGGGCPKCANNGPSKSEVEIYKFIKQFISNIKKSDRKVLKGKELDIYIPELNLAIEYNGLYWHSDLYKNRLYHLNKLKLANSNNIKLIQIFEDEWMYKQDIVKSRLLNIIGKTPNKLYARKCEIREVESKDSSNFLEQNHIQGKLGAKVKLGLYYDNELVSLMTFGNLRKNLGSTSKEGSYELLRFCNKLNTTVIGGASKLFKYFITNYNPINIISYADRRWSEGNLYYNLGFKLLGETKPNYFYTNKRFLKRESRFKYRKDILVKQGFNPNKSEHEIMKERGYARTYDCGTLKFEYKSN